MAFDFPNAPTVNQVYQGYTWDGEKWIGPGTPALAANVVMRSYLAGLTLSTPGSSVNFTVQPGVAADSTNAAMIALVAAMTKTTSPWTLGNAGGALDTGIIQASTWYHVYLIRRFDTGVVDVAISTSAVGPTTGLVIPGAYTQSRRIGSMKTNASSQWTAFSQLGDEFLWAANVTDVNSTTQSSTAILNTLTVPTGVKVWALFAAEIFLSAAGADACVYISSLDQNDEAAATSGSAAGPMTVQGYMNTVNGATYSNGSVRTRTNTSAQVRSRANTTLGRLIIQTYGWIDTRGKDN